ncbi:ArsR family transcriptional regulator [Halobacteriales archaeon QS_1_68_20]|nr:MAG: ArsR family transcriptional regulator [Halobacteriales archaeon QS_1_68_20]
MVHAFIMVKTAAGKSESLLSDVQALDGVDRAHIVAGDWDLVVEVSVDEVYDVLQTAASRIQELDGVSDTRTYVVLE